MKKSKVKASKLKNLKRILTVFAKNSREKWKKFIDLLRKILILSK